MRPWSHGPFSGRSTKEGERSWRGTRQERARERRRDRETDEKEKKSKRARVFRSLNVTHTALPRSSDSRSRCTAKRRIMQRASSLTQSCARSVQANDKDCIVDLSKIPRVRSTFRFRRVGNDSLEEASHDCIVVSQIVSVYLIVRQFLIFPNYVFFTYRRIGKYLIRECNIKEKLNKLFKRRAKILENIFAASFAFVILTLFLISRRQYISSEWN